MMMHYYYSTLKLNKDEFFNCRNDLIMRGSRGARGMVSGTPTGEFKFKSSFLKNYRKIGLEYYQTYAYYLFLNEIRNVMTKVNRNVQHYLLNLCM